VAGLLEQVCVARGLPYFVGLLQARRVKWLRHLASMDEKINLYEVLVEKVKEINCLADMGMNWSLSECILIEGCELDPSGAG
jgi:hypothetical protein